MKLLISTLFLMLTTSAFSSSKIILSRILFDGLIQDSNKIYSQATFFPQQDKNGLMLGLRLFSIKPNTFISKLGLKEGDIVQKINGVKISEPECIEKIKLTLQDTSKLSLEVKRQGTVTKRSYIFR